MIGLDSTIQRAVDALERIADALEKQNIAKLSDAPAPQGVRVTVDPEVVVTGTGTAGGEPVTEKPKRKRRTKAEMEAARAAEAYPAPAAETPPTENEPIAGFDFLNAPATAATLTKDDVRNALIAYQGIHGKDATFALIEKHGGTNLNDLPEGSYAALIIEAK
jgi:hypothetical protein